MPRFPLGTSATQGFYYKSKLETIVMVKEYRWRSLPPSQRKDITLNRDVWVYQSAFPWAREDIINCLAMLKSRAMSNEGTPLFPVYTVFSLSKHKQQ